MRKLILIPLLCATSIFGFCQQNQVRIDEYFLPGDKAVEYRIIVAMPFGKPDVLSISGDTNALRLAGEIMIDIVCTDYPGLASLEKLNDARLKKIFQLFPVLSEKKIGKINFLRQLNGTEKDVAKIMFHGAVITYRPAQTKETM